MYIIISMYVYLAIQKQSNTGKKKNMQIWVTNTVTISLIYALPIFDWLFNVTLMGSLESAYWLK